MSASVFASASQSPPPNTSRGLQPREGLVLILVGVVLSASLIPIAVVLLYHSTPNSRRRLVYISNLLAITLGIAEGALVTHTLTKIVLGDAFTVSRTLSTLLALIFLVPIFVQSILLFRLLTPHQCRHLTSTSWIVMSCPIAAMKIARVTIVALLVSCLQHQNTAIESAFEVPQDVWGNRLYVILACFLQLFDDMYASALLIWTPQTEVVGARPGTADRNCSSHTFLSLVISSFVPPVVLDIAQVVMIFAEPDDIASGTYVPLANSFVQIICVVLATLWSPHPHTDAASRADVGLSAQTPRGDSGRVATGTMDPGMQACDGSWSTEKALLESIRGLNMQVGVDDVQEQRLKWLVELGKDRPHEPAQTSLCPSVMFDNTGQPVVYYAV